MVVETAPAPAPIDDLDRSRQDAAGTPIHEGDLLVDVRGRLCRMIHTEPSLSRHARVIRAEIIAIRCGALFATGRTELIRVFECLRTTEAEVLSLGLPALQARRVAAYTAMLTDNGRIPWEA